MPFVASRLLFVVYFNVKLACQRVESGFLLYINTNTVFKRWRAAVQLVEALHNMPEGRGFDSRWGHFLNPSGRTMALGSTQPITWD
jgi:hypothetical protein